MFRNYWQTVFAGRYEDGQTNFFDGRVEKRGIDIFAGRHERTDNFFWLIVRKELSTNDLVWTVTKREKILFFLWAGGTYFLVL